MVGYDDQLKAYRCFDYDKRKIIISRDIKFQEDELGIPGKQQHEDDVFKLFIDSNSLSAKKRLKDLPLTSKQICPLPKT